jgi:hypothetical protein
MSTAIVTVPKAAVDKDGNPGIEQNKIRVPGNILRLFAESNLCDSHQSFARFFGAGSTRSHGPHNLAALCSGERVCHTDLG